LLRKIRENDRLHLFIDTESFEKSFSDIQKRLLTYNKIECFEFLRSDFVAERPDILSVKQSGINLAAEYVQQIDTISKHALKDRSLTHGEKEFLSLILFYRSYYRQAYPTNFLFVTDNNFFIKHYQSLESFFPSIRLVKTETALSLMDLFAKSNGLYFVTPQWRETKKSWYWSYFRSKVPYYKVPTPLPASLSFTSNQILESFALRFICLLTSIDEIGIQNYFGNDKDLMIPYHFNYFISLTTGIFDSLAIETKAKYNIQFEHDYIWSKISLSSSGKDFLNEVRKKDPALVKCRSKYANFIKLIYELRELVLHREGLKEMGYFNDIRMSNFYVVSKSVADLIRACGDKFDINTKMSKWGVINETISIDGSLYFYLQPFCFARYAGLKLVEFCNEYLRLMGFNKFVDSLKAKDHYLELMKKVQDSSLAVWVSERVSES
jgi:hypothetical protein